MLACCKCGNLSTYCLMEAMLLQRTRNFALDAVRHWPVGGSENQADSTDSAQASKSSQEAGATHTFSCCSSCAQHYMRRLLEAMGSPAAEGGCSKKKRHRQQGCCNSAGSQMNLLYLRLLHLPHIRVHAPRGHELVVRALLDHQPAAHHHDLVAVADRALRREH